MNTATPFKFLRTESPGKVEAGPVAGASSSGHLPACGRRVCAWCTPQRDMGPAPELAPGKITHGICPDCFAVQFREVAPLPTVEVKQHPQGGFTHAVLQSGTARTFRGWWPTRPAANAAL
jgi:hypothetical protein